MSIINEKQVNQMMKSKGKQKLGPTEKARFHCRNFPQELVTLGRYSVFPPWEPGSK